MIVLVMLKVPWAKAMVISGARFKKLSNHWIKPVNGTRKIIQITVLTQDIGALLREAE